MALALKGYLLSNHCIIQTFQFFRRNCITYTIYCILLLFYAFTEENDLLPVFYFLTSAIHDGKVEFISEICITGKGTLHRYQFQSQRFILFLSDIVRHKCEVNHLVGRSEAREGQGVR